MQFVDVASGFASEITIHKDDMSVNGKNLMDVMMLAATQGTRLRVRAAGPDAPEAIEALNIWMHDYILPRLVANVQRESTVLELFTNTHAPGPGKVRAPFVFTVAT